MIDSTLNKWRVKSLRDVQGDNEVKRWVGYTGCEI